MVGQKIESYIDGKPVVPERYETGWSRRSIAACTTRTSNKASQGEARTRRNRHHRGRDPAGLLRGLRQGRRQAGDHQRRALQGREVELGRPPGSGKSALLANSRSMRPRSRLARPPLQGKVAVVYFALERKELVKRRMRAHAMPRGAVFEMKDGRCRPARRRRHRSNLPIAVAGKAIDLLNSSCVEIIVETVRAAEAHYGCPVGLIVIDTFNKGIAMGGGDENAAKDQNITAANLQQVQDQLTDIHIALIGHTGKDESRGARGRTPISATSI